MALIQIKDLYKSFGENDSKCDVLKGLNLDVKDGEFLVIVGESGGGKSTLLNIMSGLDRATQGKVIWNDIDISRFSEKNMTKFRADNMGFIFQFYNLIPSLTVLENIEVASELSSTPLNPEELLTRVGLVGMENKFPAQLSGGEQQRVAICRAISKNPHVIFCDEPTGALDFETGIKILELLLEMNKKYKKTIILITHNAPIAKIADRVIRIRSGEIIEVLENKMPMKVADIEW